MENDENGRTLEDYEKHIGFWVFEMTPWSTFTFQQERLKRLDVFLLYYYNFAWILEKDSGDLLVERLWKYGQFLLGLMCKILGVDGMNELLSFDGESLHHMVRVAVCEMVAKRWKDSLQNRWIDLKADPNYEHIVDCPGTPERMSSLPSVSLRTQLMFLSPSCVRAAGRR